MLSSVMLLNMKEKYGNFYKLNTFHIANSHGSVIYVYI